MESDMYSIAQHAVAKGYGKIEYLRAQPIALSSCVSTTASPRSASSPEVARRGRGGAMGLATDSSSIQCDAALSKARLRSVEAHDSGARHGPADALDPSRGGRGLSRVDGRRRPRLPARDGGGGRSSAPAPAARPRPQALQRALRRRARRARHLGRVGADRHEGDARPGVRAAPLAARREAVVDLRADQRGDVPLLRPGAPAGAGGARAAAGRGGEAGGDDPAHARGGVARRGAGGVDGVGGDGDGAVTQRTPRSRSTIWVVAEFIAARLAWPSALAANALLALPTPKSEKPLAADSLVKLPFATREPTRRPLLGFTIFRSMATDPVRRALVFSKVGFATATPAPVAAAGAFPAMAPATPRTAPTAPSEPPTLEPVASATSLNSVTEPRTTNGPTSRWFFLTRLPGLFLFSR